MCRPNLLAVQQLSLSEPGGTVEMVNKRTIARSDKYQRKAGAIDGSRERRPLPHRHHSERAMVHALIIGAIWLTIKGNLQWGNGTPGPLRRLQRDHPAARALRRAD